jgi:hypothetical protein
VALRRSGPPSLPPDTPPVASSSSELAKERSLRIKAEEQLQQATAELEDLSAGWFHTANQMVAVQRRARRKLEERVAMLEERNNDTKERMGVLEQVVDTVSMIREVPTGRGSRGVKEKK